MHLSRTVSVFIQGHTVVYDSSLGERATLSDKDDRITVQDGPGLGQVGNVGKTFNLVAFGGDVSAYKSFASLCRSTKVNKPVASKKPWPSGRLSSVKSSAMD
ncbi:hypothetical protein BU25DRAFT_416405 [Macroventuria anomochaeta]|uniref:Uncharacterized protein n=1 Tax=Macroventuria anomochaeta TaxID=301207 RepID=A0ACB6RGQ2_9PLEO|nr:uncharacterized protein BU25DRAFT_416405 [Macroventuria anomochaeta]KAF2621090.1 hypothetical protein BU25DRAFT_416405 [Macroventuria anomochaeta]